MSERSETFPLRRRAVVEAILADRGDLLVVAGLGSAAWDITAAGDHPLNFPMWGAMGGSVAFGLGLALAQPERRTLVLSGDGDLLMGLGSFATVAVQRPANLAIVALDNERYGETGMQETATASGVDLAGVAHACGFPLTVAVRSEAELAGALPQIRKAPGPAFFTIKIRAEKLPLVLPPKDGTLLKLRFRRALLGEAAG
ncbi:MAG: aldehyde dehydrogenase [Alphaproteobacteria bacterium]|nr:aldehyde dehydrogenase [Alphaproteobacteria bacterium]